MGAARPDRFLGLLGLARRAGRTVHGAPLIFTAMRTKRPPCLVIAAADASAGAQKKLRTKCSFYRTPLLISTYDKATLAHAIGSPGELAAVAVCDEGIAKELLKLSGCNPDTDRNEEM